MRTVALVEYDPGWPARFAEERARIREAVRDRFVALEHVGSTAIPGMPAKPVIDILGGVRRLAKAEACVEALEAIGYAYVPEVEALVPDRRYFRKGPAGSRTHHLYAVVMGSREWSSMLAFRNHLRSHPESARAYADLKRRLAAAHREDREAYQEAKAPFIREVLARARGGDPGPPRGVEPPIPTPQRL